MSVQFGNPVMAGPLLARPVMESEGFSIGAQTGWAIYQNGDAYFFNIVAQGTVTATSFLGTDFVINSAGVFFYNGTPAPGTLTGSWANSAGTDAYGNAYPAGLRTNTPNTNLGVHLINAQLIFDGSNYAAAGSAAYLYCQPATSNSGQSTLFIAGTTDNPSVEPIIQLTGMSEDGSQAPYASLFGYDDTTESVTGGVPWWLGNVTSTPVNTAGIAGAGSYAGAGHLKYLSDADGNAYNTGRLVQTIGSQTITTVNTSYQNVTGAAAVVAAAGYICHVRLVYTENQSAGVPRFQFSSPATTAAAISATWQENSASTTYGGQGVTLGPVAGPTMTSKIQILDIWISATFSAAGTLQLTANTSVSGDTYAISAGGIFELIPVT